MESGGLFVDSPKIILVVLLDHVSVSLPVGIHNEMHGQHSFLASSHIFRFRGTIKIILGESTNTPPLSMAQTSF